MSKNNAKMVQQKMADQKQRFGIRKLSVGAASVLLGTVFYLQSGTVYADVNPAASVGNDSINVVNKNSSTSSSAVGSSTSNSAGSSNSVSSAGDATNSMDTRQVSASPVESATSQANKNAVAAGNEQGSSVQTSHVNAGADKTIKNENSNVDSHPTYVPNSHVALEKPVAGSGRVDSRGEAPFKPVLAMKAETETPVAKPAVDSEAPKRETVDSKWIIHYVNQTDHKQELKDPTVITMQYARTNTPQSDGKTQYGDWSYVPGSFKQTGTQITINDSDNPVKQDNVDKNGENMDVFTITAMYPTIAGYTMHNNINGTRLHDDLENDNRQADTMSKDFYAEYDVAKERSVSVKFVDDDDFNQQVGQAITLTGRDGDTVKVNVTVPDKYQLANGQQLPTTYTFTNGSGGVTIHLAHKVIQREAAVNVQLIIMTGVNIGGVDGPVSVISQTRWGQLDDSFKHGVPGPDGFNKVFPSVEVGTLTGYVNYDVVDNSVVSLGDDWTTLNLGGHTYQLPNGDDVVNGVLMSDEAPWGQSFRKAYLTTNPNVDPDYATRPWHGYLSVNTTGDLLAQADSLGLQGGLAGNESNALAKANGDQAATAVEIANKTIDVSLLNRFDGSLDFSEQDGRLQNILPVRVYGVYIPYVEKIATRTINITTPDGKTTSVKQTATLTKRVDFSKDAHPSWTTGEWASYDVPTIPGYTVSQSQVAKESVTGATNDQTVNITYTANPQTATVIYQTEDGTPVHTTTVNGQTGQTVKVSSEVPVGWKVINGNVPSEITFGPDGAPQTVVTIAHQHVTINPDQPQNNGTKLPDNPAKTFSGVEANDLNKTITRTIKVRTPDGQTKTIEQTSKLTRTADVDEVTGEVKYSDWTTGNWSAYAAPDVPGYTASQSHVAQQAVTDATKDQTIDITYTANDHQIIVEYVDNATGQIVKTDHVSGKTGQTVSITPHVPDGWELVSGQSVPSEVTLGADGAPATVIKVQPQERSVSVKFVDDQSLDWGTTYNNKQVGQAVTLTGRDGEIVDLHLTVPDKYQLADGQQLPTTYTFAKGSDDLTIHLVHQVVQREAIVDVQMELIAAVRVDDGELPFVTTQNRWAQLDDKIKDDGQPNDRMYPLVKVGTLTGHVGYDLVDNKVVSFADDWTTLNLGGQTYQMPDGTEAVNGIFVAYYHGTLGEPFKEELLKHHPDADPDYANRPWHGYLSVNATNKLLSDVTGDILQSGLVGNEPNTLAKANGDQTATAVKSANKTVDLSLLQYFGFETRDFSEQNGRLQGIADLQVAGVYIPYVEKTATRTINVTTPDGKTSAVTQIATLAKQVDFSKDAHPAWTTGEWTNYDVPTIPGYTASQSQVAKETVTGETKDQTVKITYTANDQSTHVNYVDAQGKLIHATTVNGKTGQTVKVSSEIPDGWKLVDGQTVPDTITFGSDGHEDMSVKIEHRHVTVTPDKSQANGTELPDNSKQSFHDVEASDLNKTVTRMIKVTTPTGKTNTIKQEAKLTRTATIDEVTGDVSYGDWSIGQWDAYQVPSLNGYTATQPEVAATSVNESTKDQTVDVSYTPNKQSTVVKYVDDKGQVVHTTTVDGVTDQTVKVPNEVPAGWMITKGEVPSEITFGVDGHEPIEVAVEHHHVTVDPTDPKNPTDTLPDNPAKNYPAGVSESDLNKTITRTIKITQPDGTATNKVQTVKLTRTADVDEVTGEVTYGKWTTGAWDAYEIPSAKGYTASQASVAAMPVTSDTKDQTVEVSYAPNTQSTGVKYVDDKGQVVHTTTVNGVTDQTVKVPSEVPAGWMIAKGQVPNEITFGSDGHDSIKVTVAHRHVTVDPAHPQTNGTKLSDNPAKTFEGVEANDLNKTITRTIKVTTPDGKSATTKQIAKLTRNADVDEVTGGVTYGNWTTGQWDSYEIPALKGYTASQTDVEATPVDENTKDQTVEVSYTPNKQSTTIKYVDDKGQTIHTTIVDGVTDQTVKVPNEVPAGWMITKGEVPSNITFGPNGHEPVVVTVDHRHVTVTPDHPQNNGTKLPDNPAKTFEGVEANDLNKTITRTIEVTTPDGKSATTKQTAKLTRTADVDEVTGEVTYGNWTTGEWTAYDVPTVPGYTPSKTMVAKESVTATSKNTTVEISYLPMQHQISVEYVDDDDHGKIVKTDQVPGKTDQTITVTPSAPANYDLVDNGNRTYTVTSDDAQAVQIHVKHHQVTTSESKTVTRTINVRTPHDGTKVVKQNAELTRKVTTDQVTGDKTYGNWTTGKWESYTPEAIPGYTPSTNEVPGVNVDGNSKNQMVDVTYTADAQKVEIVYVDDTKGNAVVKTDQIDGKTDETVKVTPDVPTGYELAGKVTGDYTMTADGHQTITVHLVHQMKTASESKAVTRTININTPHDGTTVFKQTVDLSRDVTTDQVTGDKTYGDWSTTEWTHYDVPAVAGYTPSIKQVAQQVVNGMTMDQTIDITYSSGEHTTHINYVDGDGNIVHTTMIKGQTDGTAQVPNETPAGWMVVGKPVPTEITFGPDGHADVTVTVDHQHVTVTPDQSKAPTDKLPDNPGKTYPNGVGHDDLNRTVTRTIKVVTPDGQTKTVTQTAKLIRTADVDEVTGEVTYGKWTTGEWSRYKVPSVPGYTVSQSDVPAVNVTDTTKDQMLTLTYTANDQTTHVNYVDSDGKTVHTTTITGETDQTVKVPNEVPTGWTITNGQVPAEITFGPDGHADVVITVGHQHVTVTPDQPKTPSDKLPNNPGKTYPSGVGHDDLNKTVTRTIKVTTPDGKTQTTAQKVQLTRTADVDEVTGEVTYCKWTTGEWANYDVPAVPGYTASQSNVPAAKVTSDTKNQTVTVTYTANAQTTTISYVDQNGKTVHTTVVNGHTDQTVKVPNEVPAGWTIIDGQVPTEITLGPNGHDRVTVTVDHKHATVTPDKPQTDGTKLPDNPSKTFHGVSETDLNKAITRTIEVTAPTGKTETIKQTAKLTRSADVDEVTGEVTYSKWTTGAWSSYTVPTVAGYTPSQAVVAEVAVNADTTDQTVKIAYTADSHTTHINYIDENGEVVYTTTIKGHTDQTVKVPNETPAGWTITAGQVPSEVAFGPDGNPDVTVTVDHQHVTVPPDQPKTSTDKLPDNPAKTYPNGVEHDDLNKTVTRTIKVITPDGQTKTVVQTAKLTRTANVDEVTGEVTYGKWTTSEWSSYEVPAAHGYTASQNEVPAVKVTDDTKDQTVAVTYTANDQTTHINYVDDNGKIVHMTTITGKTDQTVKVPNEVPTGWTITNGQVPSEVIFGANGYDDVTVTIGHQHVTVTPDKPKTNGTQLPDNPRKTFHGVSETDLNKVVTRTIEVASPAQKTTTVKQTAKLTRTADVDEVTGEVTYGKWATGSWSSYTVPTVAGYTPSQAVVAEVAVDANTADQTVKITYTADSHTTHINYVDKDSNVVHTTTVTGATGQTVKVPNEVPTDWKVTGESVPTELTFGPDGHADVTVTVDHQHVTMTPDKPRENDTKLSNTINKATQNAQTMSQSISIRTSQTSTPQTTNDVHTSPLPQATNDVHESQLPQTGNKTDSQIELIGLIGIAFAGLTGLFGFGTRRKKRD